MKKIILLLTIGLFFLSCSSDSSNSSNSNGLLLKTFTTQEGLIENYYYDGYKIQSFTSNDPNACNYTFSYIGDLIVREDIFHTDNTPYNMYFIYSYDNNNRLIKCQHFVATVQAISGYRCDYFYSFIYNSDGTVSRYRSNNIAPTYAQDDFQTSTAFKKYYYDSNMNVVKIVNVDNTNTTISTETLTYDTKNAPTKNIIGLDKINFRDDQIIGIQGSNNNVLTDDMDGPYGYSLFYTLQYNSQNYPIQGSSTYSENGSVNTSYATAIYY